MKFPIVVFTLLFICVSPVLAADPPRQLYDFATSLYNEGNYFGAVLEYERLLNYYPASNLAEDSSFMIGMSYVKAGKSDEAVKAFDLFIFKYPNSGKTSDALTRIAQCYYGSKEFGLGIRELNKHKDGSLSNLSEYLMGWGYVGEHLFNEGESVFYYLGTREGEFKANAYGLSQDLKLAGKVPQKSPLLAAVFSAIIPGTGQMYAEKYYDGMVSFLLNAVFIYLTAENSRTGNNGTSLFFGVIELGWYSSNIYGAVRSTDKYNYNNKEEFVKELKIKYGFEF